MVDTFGFRPFGRGSYGAPAPFGFAPQVPQSPASPPTDDGQGDDFASVIPVAKRFSLFCQNRDCGERTAGVVYPLCQSCNERLKWGGAPIILENGRIITKPIVPGE
jgi:hypothetical protein